MQVVRPQAQNLSGFAGPRFVVRDISEQYPDPTFELVFRDYEHGVERCSDCVWNSYEEARQAADVLEKSERRPFHWGVLQSLYGQD